MDVYNSKSVYKAPGIYRSGVYKDPLEVVLLNGVRYENRFYEIDSNNVGSTFVDAVQLPEGYEKLGRVWYNGPYGNSYPFLIDTDFQLPEQFGDIYCGFNLVNVTTNWYSIFTTAYYSASSYRRLYYSNVEMSNSVSAISIWNNVSGRGLLSNSVQFSDENKVKEDLLNGTLVSLPNQSGTFPPSRSLHLMSSRGLCYFRFLFVADRNRQVTFTAIPCKYGSDYGLYDVVAGKFYTHANLTGD